MTEALPSGNAPSPRWGGLVFLVVLLVLLVVAAFYVQQWLEDEQKVPVQHIQILGERTHIEDDNVRQFVRQQHAGSFFELNVTQVHEDLESMPWVYRASVRKRWPNTLNLFLVEQVAVAHWNSDQLLNQYGESFQAQLSVQVLPSLFGPGGSEQTALQGYRAMQSLLNTAGLEIEELTLSERYAWNIRLTNGIRLNIGRTEFVDRLQRFVDLYPLLKKEPRGVEYVDLRYDTGLAVGWAREQEQS